MRIKLSDETQCAILPKHSISNYLELGEPDENQENKVTTDALVTFTDKVTSQFLSVRVSFSFCLSPSVRS